MKITFLGHATILLEVEGKKFVFDPHLNESYRHNLFGYYPKRELDSQIFDSVDGIFISHSHRDHFDVSSLKRLNRDAICFIPNDARIIHSLNELHFKNVLLFEDWSTIEVIPNLNITWTPSTYRVPEHGYLIQYKEISLWNMVDSHLTEEWCHKINELVNNKLEILLFPCQPLIESNTSHAILPIVSEHKIQEIKMVIDLVKPVYTVPFADGHYCLNNIKWVNNHWIPFNDLQKYEAIDRADYKTQIIGLDTGNIVEFKKYNGVFDYSVSNSKLIHKIDYQIDRVFNPSLFVPSIKSKEYSLNDIQSIKDIFEQKINLYDKFSFLKNKIFFLNSNYHFMIIGMESEILNTIKFCFEDGVIKKGEIESDNLVEIAVSCSDFLNVMSSKLSFTAILIGGLIREFHYLDVKISNPKIFRDFSDLEDNNPKSIVSGIFIVNQLLVSESNRFYDEVDREIQNDIVFFNNNELVKEELTQSKSLLSNEIFNLIENHLSINNTLNGFSNEYIIDGQKTFIGIFGDKFWNQTTLKNGILICFNLLKYQSIFGHGITFPHKDYSQFLGNIIKCNVQDWIIYDDSNLYSSTPNWRKYNIFPFQFEKLKSDLLKLKWQGRVKTNTKNERFKSKWWLGINEEKFSTQTRDISISYPEMTVRGTINKEAPSSIKFKSHQNFSLYISEIVDNSHPIINSIILGNLRFNWKTNELKTKEELKINVYEEVFELQEKIILDLIKTTANNV